MAILVGALSAVFVLITAAAVVWTVDDVVDEFARKMGAEIGETRRQLADTNTEVIKQAGKLEAIAQRLQGIDQTFDRIDRRLERMEVQLGLPPLPLDPRPAWSAGHVERREKHCMERCGAELVCFTACADAFNACGVKYQFEPPSGPFLECVRRISDPTQSP